MELTGYKKTTQRKGKPYIQNNHAHTDKKSQAKISASWSLALPYLSRQVRRGLLLCTCNVPNTPPSLRMNHFILSCSCPPLVLCILKPFCTASAQRTRVLQPYLSHLAHLLALQQPKRSSTRAPRAAPAPAVLPQVHHAQHVLWRSTSIQLVAITSLTTAKVRESSPALYLLLLSQIELAEPGGVFRMSMPSWVYDTEEQAGNNAVI